MVRSLALLAFLICAASGAAQVRVEVHDGGTGEAVPYAHAYWHPLGEAADRMQVSDPNGVLLLPASAAEAEQGLVLRLSFVGFTTRTDTLFGTGPHRLSLERATVGLQEFVVTAQYAPRPVDEAVQRMKVIGEEQVQRMAANDLGSALRNETNLRLGQDNVLGTSMSMQGLSGENVKILVDGVPVVGRLDGNIDLSQIDLTGIERIEVVEGPLSVSYGTNALAGTINLITRKRGRGRTFGAKVYAEHIGRLNTTVQGFWQRGGHSLAVSGGRNFFSGWNPDQTGLPDLGPAPADTNRWQQWKPREQYFGRLNYRWALRDWELGYKGEVMHDKITDRGLPRAPYFETAFDQVFTTVRLDNALFATRTWTGSTLQAQAAYQHYSRTRNTWYRDLTDLGGELIDAEGMQDTARFTLANGRMTWSTRRDSSAWDLEAGLDLNYETGTGERIGDGEQAIGDYAAFASVELRPTKGLTLRPAARVAYNTRYAAPIVPSLNARWALGERFVLRGAYAMGFRAPSLKELYFYFVDVNHDIVGNPDLEAERAHHGDLSLTYRHARKESVYTADAGLFLNDVRDLITLAQVQGTRYSYVNIGRVRTFGGSVNAGWDNGHWAFSTGLALTGREDDLVGTQQWTTPEVRASLTRNWRRHGWRLSAFYKYTGEQVAYVALSDTEVARNTISAFHLADANVAKTLWKDRLTVALGCNDLFDVANLQASFAGGAHSAGGNAVPMTTGRTFFLRLDLQLDAKP